MRIGILGTRGIPNNYGGFEQFAQHLSDFLVKRGHEVVVYNSHTHPYQEDNWNGVQIVHQFDPENSMGTAGQFIYDLNCIIDSRKRGFDIILSLGYTSSSVWYNFFSKKPIILTNMDGLEWKRSKYSRKVQRFLLYAEKLAVKKSDGLIADSKGIQSYLDQRYKKPSHFIAYGATRFNDPDEKVLHRYGLLPYDYNLIIARMEPENNIETLLDGHLASGEKKKLFVVGNCKNKFGQRMVEKFKDHKHIVFAGTIYDQAEVNNLRHFCGIYFHGHSVGGTNPSLLESMACGCLIVAHDNEFNRSVLENDALYFRSAADVSAIVSRDHKDLRSAFSVNNYQKIETRYSWTEIGSAYEQLMIEMLGHEQK